MKTPLVLVLSTTLLAVACGFVYLGATAPPQTVHSRIINKPVTSFATSEHSEQATVRAQ